MFLRILWCYRMTQINAICTDVITYCAFSDNLGITDYHRFQSLSDRGDSLAYPMGCMRMCLSVTLVYCGYIIWEYIFETVYMQNLYDAWWQQRWSLVYRPNAYKITSKSNKSLLTGDTTISPCLQQQQHTVEKLSKRVKNKMLHYHNICSQRTTNLIHCDNVNVTSQWS